MITSQSNDKVKMVRRLQTDRRFRAQTQLFVVEGNRWLQELIDQQVRPLHFFFTASWQATQADSLHQLANLTHQPGLLVSDAVMAAMSDTSTPPGILAVLPTPQRPLPPNPSLLLILDSITTPGNLGTIIRTAAAAGADGLLLAPGCVDATNPKVVRGSMGALLRLPILNLSWPEISQLTADMAVWLAAVSADTAYTAVDWQRPSALIIGSEANGASPQAQQLAQQPLTIPMQADTESLNAAVAASIILFEARRQRQA